MSGCPLGEGLAGWHPGEGKLVGCSPGLEARSLLLSLICCVTLSKFLSLDLFSCCTLEKGRGVL